MKHDVRFWKHTNLAGDGKSSELEVASDHENPDTSPTDDLNSVRDVVPGRVANTHKPDQRELLQVPVHQLLHLVR